VLSEVYALKIGGEIMEIKEVKAKTIITKTKLGGDYVINPYTGCQHGCKYCYAKFMKRFTGHKEPWGDFVDVKINAADLIPEDTDKYRDKYILIGSVTDPYQPIESKYELTRKILEKLLPLQPHLSILTKSDLIVRDIDLIKQFKDCTVAISLSMLDERFRRQLEPVPPEAGRKFKALKKLHDSGITTVLFISPIFPGFTEWKEMVKETKSFVDEYWFENLNLYPSIAGEVYKFLKKNKPELAEEYREIYSGHEEGYWHGVEDDIRGFCLENNLECQVYFHYK